MQVEVRLPDLGDDAVAEVSVSSWLAEPGSKIREGDDLLEITTDKAAFCVASPHDGVLAEVRVSTGDDIHVGDVICVMDV